MNSLQQQQQPQYQQDDYQQEFEKKSDSPQRFQPLEVKIGKYKLINSKLWPEHWAIKIGKNWYELEGGTGSGLFDVSPNYLIIHQNDSKYSKIKSLGYTNEEEQIEDEDVINFAKSWIWNHPNYSVFSDNCQSFVKDMIWRWLKTEMNTQPEKLANRLFTVGFLTSIFALGSISAGMALTEDGKKKKKEKKEKEVPEKEEESLEEEEDEEGKVLSPFTSRLKEKIKFWKKKKENPKEKPFYQIQAQ